MKSTDKLTKYDDWYVIQVKPGRETYVKEFIEHNSCRILNLIVFRREIIHRMDGKYITVTTPLFPGYIFVHKDILYVSALARKRLPSEFVRPVKFAGLPGKVTNEEMEALLKISSPSGIIELSGGQKKEGRIIITKGPLKDMNVKVIFVNEKKRKMKVEFALLGRTVTMSLGFDFINHETTAA